MIAIEFSDPTRMLEGEMRSKHLDVRSELVRVLREIKDKIGEHFSVQQSRPFHIELVDKRWGNAVSKQTVKQSTLQRANQLQGRKIELSLDNFVFMTANAFVLKLPRIQGYSGLPHTTVAYLSDKRELEHNECYVRKIFSITAMVLLKHGFRVE